MTPWTCRNIQRNCDCGCERVKLQGPNLDEWQRHYLCTDGSMQPPRRPWPVQDLLLDDLTPGTSMEDLDVFQPRPNLLTHYPISIWQYFVLVNFSHLLNLQDVTSIFQPFNHFPTNQPINPFLSPQTVAGLLENLFHHQTRSLLRLRLGFLEGTVQKVSQFSVFWHLCWISSYHQEKKNNWLVVYGIPTPLKNMKVTWDALLMW